MRACTFLGHSNAPRDLEPKIREVIECLIIEKQADCFYVGNSGSFDYMVRKVLRELVTEHPHIQYSVVLAYLPTEKDELDIFDYSDADMNGDGKVSLIDVVRVLKLCVS